MTRASDEKFARTAGELLDQGLAELPADVRIRLKAARRAALDKATRPRDMWLRPLAGLAVAAALLVVFAAPSLFHDASPALPAPNMASSVANAPEVVEVLAAEEGLEFYDQLDFFAWLAAAEDGDRS